MGTIETFMVGMVDFQGLPWRMGSHDGRMLVVNSHGDRKSSPKDRVVGPLRTGLTSWHINGGDPNY